MKNNLGSLWNVFVNLILVLALSGCATTATQPQKPSIFSTVTSITVLPFEGDEGDIFSRELESILISLQSKEGVNYQVYTRKNIPDLLNEMRFQDSGLTEKEKAIKIGNFIGVEFVMTGHVETSSRRGRVQRNFSECIERKNIFKCKKSRTRKVYCDRIEASFRAVPVLLAVKTGAVVYSRIADGEIVKDVCPGFSSTGDPIKASRSKVLRVIEQDVFPHRSSHSFGFGR